MKFTKEFLQYLIVDNNQAELIEDTVMGIDVNNVFHKIIFKYEDRLYRKYYYCGKLGYVHYPLNIVKTN